MRVAELVGGLSLATDMGAGLPLQSALAATVLATRMAARLGLSDEQQQITYYAAILRFVGCSATAPEAAQMGAGDDQSFNYAFVMCDMADAKDVERALDRYWNTGADPRIRRDVIRSMAGDLSQVAQAAVMHCAQAVILSKRMSLHDRVPEMLGYMYDRFDGTASAHRGDEIPVPARLCNLAANTVVMLRSLGRQTAMEMVALRKGGQFCPECVAVLERDDVELLNGLDEPSCWETYLDAEPGPRAQLEDSGIERICTAYADYGDQKCGYLLGHSRHVAALSFLAAEAAEVDADTRHRLRLAALLHDVGRAGVPTGLWDKRGALSRHERQIVQSHSGHTETVLGLSEKLREVIDQASAAHERADRTGYPRALSLDDRATGVLAAADVYDALTHDRPWRKAYAAPDASNMLLAEANAGRLPRRAVAAVLEAAGHGKRVSQAAYPAGLSQREVEVLALLAAGMSNQEIAERLALAPKTAENHVGRIYEKTGARGRAAAALFAVEHGLHEQSLDPAAS